MWNPNDVLVGHDGEPKAAIDVLPILDVDLKSPYV